MAEVTSLYKQHPLYQEDLERIAQLPGIEGLYGKSFLISGATGLIGVCLIDALMHLNKKGANITIYALGRSRRRRSSPMHPQRRQDPQHNPHSRRQVSWRQ